MLLFASVLVPLELRGLGFDVLSSLLLLSLFENYIPLSFQIDVIGYVSIFNYES